MSQVLDYSYARPGGAAIAAAGYVGVMRYLSFDVTKNLNTGELADLQAYGLSIGLVWETTATRALSGRAGGQFDATAALWQARELGYPETCALYFAVDFDTSPGDQPMIDDYFRGCADVAGVAGVGRLGVYGSFYVVERCFASGVVSYGWQTLAWSGGHISTRAALYQNGSKAFGQDADVNDVRGDYGPWGGTDLTLDPTQQNELKGAYLDAHTTASLLALGVQTDPVTFQPVPTDPKWIVDQLAALNARLDALPVGGGLTAAQAQQLANLAAAVVRIEKALQSA